MSTVLSPTPSIAGEPDLAGRLARPDGPRRANPAAARASHTLRRSAAALALAAGLIAGGALS